MNQKNKNRFINKTILSAWHGTCFVSKIDTICVLAVKIGSKKRTNIRYCCLSAGHYSMFKHFSSFKLNGNNDNW